MTRAHLTALALVNWKGVFYERYQLDRHVTALEGANGAGKTTVMIAAYVVLMPDLARLRFTTVGEGAQPVATAACSAGSASPGDRRTRRSSCGPRTASGCWRACGWCAAPSRASS
jgi:chromosome condensin MukBEF ATPase and DNA-binding subunit MukB